MLIKELISINENISTDIEDNLDWLKLVFSNLSLMSVGSRFDNKAAFNLEKLFTDQLPPSLKKYFTKTNVKLGRVTATGVNVKEYIETGKLSIYHNLHLQ